MQELNHLPRLSVTKLKPLLHSDKSGTATLTLGGALVSVEKQAGSANLTISYPGHPTLPAQQVGFQVMPSNLGKGEYYQFLCPHTLEPCLYLYIIKSSYQQQNEVGLYMLTRYAYKHLTGYNLYRL